MEEERGTIAFFATYRPPVPLDIYSSPYKPTKPSDETLMTDGQNYNYNAQVIPPAALKTILRSKKLATAATESDIEAGRVTGLLFVSERTNNLETLHIGIQFHDGQNSKFEAFNFAEAYGSFKGTRMEDSGCIAGDYLVYVSSKDRPATPHQPWTAIFKTHLLTGTTQRLTPTGPGRYDLSPAVSPDGKKIAMATFQRKGGWDGEIEDLGTDIFVMNVDKPANRVLLVENGGWPTWASNDILFFHRKTNTSSNDKESCWGVYQLDRRTNPPTQTRVTPKEINAITPAAINETTVAVATIRKKYNINNPEKEREINEYRHIEIFGFNGQPLIRVTETVWPRDDHFNPFVIVNKENGGLRIGYHRCNTHNPDAYRIIRRQFDKFQSPDTENVGIVRVSGVFPTFSPDGSKLAFVDNEFKAVWVADTTGLFIAYETSGADSVFSPVWNNNKEIDTLYFCVGPSFQSNAVVNIAMITNVSERSMGYQLLTDGYNNAFPFTSPDGSKIVYRSTRGHDGDINKRYKNLFIMDAEYGDMEEPMQLTKGNCIDTHCQWSSNQKWIVFSSNRANPIAQAPPGLPDPGFFGIYLTKADDPNFEPVKVIDSGLTPSRELFPGHCVHPCFSPDGKSLIFIADLAAVSVDPISLPLFMHSVRPYGDIFMVNLNVDDISKNKEIHNYIRITHSRYEHSTATWTALSTEDPHAKWNLLIAGHSKTQDFRPACPYMHASSSNSIHMTTQPTLGG
ncbi:hypothetical protein vseg_008642 [Gypsophila vaccaria]